VFLAPGAFIVSIDHSPDLDNELRKLLQDNHIDPSIAEGLRLIIAFRKISNPAERRAVIELAERLAK
jgi:hypothetical protein